jgi:hypothetical protein
LCILGCETHDPFWGRNGRTHCPRSGRLKLTGAP